MNKKIAKLLREKGDGVCVNKAEVLEKNLSDKSTLHLRHMLLNENDIVRITHIIEEDKGHIYLKTISFSYNQLIGDVGATLLAKKLPHTIHEIGLVDCGIGDTGGAEILNWMRKAQSLKMICMEQNNFSKRLKVELKAFKSENPGILVVY